jgi:hypothetical protein
MWHGLAPDDGLVAVPSGAAYRVVSPPANALVTRDLAGALGRVLERYGREAGFSERRPVAVFFRPGVLGHHRVGRAADLYEVGGVGLDVWKQRWDEAMARARAAGATEGRAIVARERARNLGWRLYKALQIHGRWAEPAGYPPQLFGPWTRSEGPWTRISDRLLGAHRDHVHVAR